MTKMKPTRDIQPVTEFRARAAEFMNQVRENGAPMYLTQHGRTAAVLLDVDAYEALTEELELLREIRISEAEIAEGKVYTHASVMKYLATRVGQ